MGGRGRARATVRGAVGWRRGDDAAGQLRLLATLRLVRRPLRRVVAVECGVGARRRGALLPLLTRSCPGRLHHMGYAVERTVEKSGHVHGSPHILKKWLQAISLCINIHSPSRQLATVHVKRFREARMGTLNRRKELVFDIASVTHGKAGGAADVKWRHDA